MMTGAAEAAQAESVRLGAAKPLLLA